MMNRFLYPLGLLIISFAVFANAQGTFDSRTMLLKSASVKKIVETARDHQWSINFAKTEKDTVHIIALRIEFKQDTSALTTGNGLFGMRGDAKEAKYYSQDTVYEFDNVYLSSDSSYFAHQLTALNNYYRKVSRGSLTLDFSISPTRAVSNQMIYYSAGEKRKTESVIAYWDRKTHGLMTFIKEAIETVDNAPNSPFKNLYRDENGILKDATTNRKAVVLIFHAGASYLTDGILNGVPDSPADMIDAFVNQDYFKQFKDTLGLAETGIAATGHQGQTFIIDEVMLCAETSNQDGVNWGIQGILVNQMARQLGIPDLFSTSSGISAIGAFCIMDFAGYSAGQGFIPPYPSAWVRAFMGWDKPYMVGAGNSHKVKALTSVLDRDVSSAFVDDTTILLIPLNNNEYYLVENRQRNLSSDTSLFRYDSKNANVINAYPFNVNIRKNVKELSNTPSKVILEAKNNDISLPASGILVWHIDERIIRQRLAYNFVNADSSYRGIRLVEADGKNDLGVTFVDAFYQAAFDYGGAEDVFPHKIGNKDIVNKFGPYSRPSTRSNDGGHTYLEIGINYSSPNPQIERAFNFQDTVVKNFSDSVFLVDVKYDHIVPGWPRRAAPDNFFDPLITELSKSLTNGGKDTVMAVLGKSGRFYLYSVVDEKKIESHGNRSVSIDFVDYRGKNPNTSITVTYFDTISGAFTFPTAIDSRIFIPDTMPNQLHIYNSIDITVDKKTIALPAKPTSYVCGIDIGRWAVGLANGRIIVGSASDTLRSIKLSVDTSVCAIASLKDSAQSFAAIQNDGTLSVIKGLDVIGTVKIKHGFPPFTIVTGDLDNDGKSELVISDSKQGVWVFTRELKLALGWKDQPNDWANAFHIDPEKQPGRARFPNNHSAPALADLSRNGHLDIVISGTNGIYALNRKGALVSKWPAYLDNRYWYQRGSITSSPIVVSSGKDQPLVLFSSPTGERATFGINKIKDANRERGVVTFHRNDGTLDSLWDLSREAIDTILTIGDSLIYPYILPGGFVDALTGDAKRPTEKVGSWTVPQSRWPISMGAPVTTSPLAWRPAPNAVPDLFAVASDSMSGMVYRWKIQKMISDSLYWPQNGFDAARSFAYGGAQIGSGSITVTEKQPITFWNYPNPTSKDDPQTTFKYKFSGQATNVRLDIHTITGRRIDTFMIKDGLTGDFPDWNEFKVNLKKYGPGIYRCRMEATIGGKKHSRMWKMAVVK